MLDDRLIRKYIKWLKGYGVKHLEQPIFLTLGGCRIEISGTNEALEVLPSLENALRFHVKKSK